MSTAAITAVFQHSKSTGAARLMLLAMADEAADTGELTAYRRSQSWFARKANVDRRTAQRAIDKLVKLGEVELLMSGGGHGPSDYQLVLPGLGEGRQDAAVTAADDRPKGGRMPPPSSRSTRSSPTPSSPDGDNGGLRLLDVPCEPLRGFPEFWEIYPTRNGKRLGRAKAEDRWRGLSLPERRAAWRGAGFYAQACQAGLQRAMDAHRWLAHREWEAWQTPAVPEPERAPPRRNGTAPELATVTDERGHFSSGTGWIPWR